MFGAVASLSARRAWIEIPLVVSLISCIFTSLSARRAWIEIEIVSPLAYRLKVALRKESVDRNGKIDTGRRKKRRNVALRKESVDRNIADVVKDVHAGVALRKESVDRNVERGPVSQRRHSRSPQGERG